jgi:AraC-like DNA-binding protein
MYESENTPGWPEPLSGFSRFVIATRNMDKTGLNNSEVMVLWCLAAHVHENSGKVDPSISSIAAECGLSTSSVKRAIKNLVSMNFLFVEPAVNPRETHDTNTYHLNIRLIESKKLVPWWVERSAHHGDRS